MAEREVDVDSLVQLPWDQARHCVNFVGADDVRSALYDGSDKRKASHSITCRDSCALSPIEVKTPTRGKRDSTQTFKSHAPPPHAQDTLAPHITCATLPSTLYLYIYTIYTLSSLTSLSTKLCIALRSSSLEVSHLPLISAHTSSIFGLPAHL